MLGMCTSNFNLVYYATTAPLPQSSAKEAGKGGEGAALITPGSFSSAEKRVQTVFTRLSFLRMKRSLLNIFVPIPDCFVDSTHYK